MIEAQGMVKRFSGDNMFYKYRQFESYDDMLKHFEPEQVLNIVNQYVKIRDQAVATAKANYNREIKIVPFANMGRIKLK